MRDRVTNILLVGVGGQGTVLAGKILAQAALRMRLDVKVSEVHGMSQRGGSVVTQVRMGPEVHSPVIARGTADAVVAFEKLECLRWVSYLAPDGRLIVNDQSINPLPVITGVMEYPVDVLDRIRQAVPSVVIVKAQDMALAQGNPKGVNMVLLGTLVYHLDVPPEVWMETLAQVVKPHTLAGNLAAFDAGLTAAKDSDQQQ